MKRILPRKIWFCLLGASLGVLAPAMEVGAVTSAPLSAESAGRGEDGAPRQDMENDPELYLQLIAGLQAKELYFASLAHLDAFDLRWPANPRATLLRADALRETAYLDKAAALYQTLLRGDQAARAYHGLGIIAGRKGDRTAAIAFLEQASRRDPTSTLILNDLGYIQLLGGQLEDARFNLHKAAELASKDARAGANLALLYLLEGKPERADGVMQWYQLPEARRKQIYSKAVELAAAAGSAIPTRAAPKAELAPQSAPAAPKAELATPSAPAVPESERAPQGAPAAPKTELATPSAPAAPKADPAPQRAPAAADGVPLPAVPGADKGEPDSIRRSE
ncbi:MAG: hypothetical protein PHX38_08025 [Sulfuricella sp.]|nr:hypothetical protein [Sulfuricella sp.]